jgi:hypothetical protein
MTERRRLAERWREVPMRPGNKKAVYIVVALVVLIGGIVLFLNNFRKYGEPVPPSVTGQTAAPSDQKR